MGLSKSQVKIKIVHRDESFKCSVSRDVPGSTMLSFACKRIGTYEPWWFGLIFTDSHAIQTWLPLNKKVGSQDISRDGEFLLLELMVKHFPEHIPAEVIQTRTIQQFYLQVRSKILSEDIYCDPGVAVLLSGLHMQYEYGDCGGTERGESLIKDNFLQLIPRGLKERHNLTDSDWLNMINDFWINSKVLSKHEALREAMNTVQNLDMYGVDYHLIRNKKKTPLYLGITSQGMNIYKLDNRLVPKVSLTWNEIRSIAYSDKKLTIKPLEKSAQEFVMYSEHNKENVNIMELCIERHQMFLERRKPDTPDVIAWKTKAKEEENKITEKIVQHKKNIEYKMEYQKKLEQVQIAKVDNADESHEANLEKELKEAYDTALDDLTKKFDILEQEKQTLLENASIELQDIELLTINQNKQIENVEKSNAFLAKEKDEQMELLKKELDQFKAIYEEDQKKIKQIEKDVASGKPVKLDPVLNPVVNAVDMKKKADRYTIRIKSRRTKTTEMDINIEEIIETGNDKFKTLKILRSGNVRSRIDQFEAL